MMARNAAAVALCVLALAGCTHTPPPPPMLAITADNCAAAPDLTLAQPLTLADKPDDAKPVATLFDDKTPCFAPAP